MYKFKYENNINNLLEFNKLLNYNLMVKVK